MDLFQALVLAVMAPVVYCLAVDADRPRKVR